MTIDDQAKSEQFLVAIVICNRVGVTSRNAPRAAKEVDLDCVAIAEQSGVTFTAGLRKAGSPKISQLIDAKSMRSDRIEFA
jgi:deoxyxylulose-5-phosphate synthase